MFRDMRSVMDTTKQLTRFEWMLEQCELNGWAHLAELIYRQYIEIQVNLPEMLQNGEDGV